MNLLLLLPAALGALLALAIPLLIHLARREQRTPTMFAALRWLHERPRPRRRIRFDEWPLLLSRLLLLAFIALWLAMPVLVGAPDRTGWTVVAAGVADDEVQRLVEAEEGEVRWLATGFPPVLSPMPVTTQPVSSLLRQLDAELPADAHLTVLVPERLSGLDADRLQLSRAVDWHVVDGGSPLVEAGERARFELVMRHDDEGATEARRILRAATLSLLDDETDADAFSSAPADTPLPDGIQRLAWFVRGPMPAEVRGWIESGGDALLASDVELEWPGGSSVVTWRDAVGEPLLETAPLGDGRVSRFTRPLQASAMPQVLEPAFPTRLQALFDDRPAPTLGFASAHAPAAGGDTWPQAWRDLQPWLALLIALTILVERWLATSRRREDRA